MAGKKKMRGGAAAFIQQQQAAEAERKDFLARCHQYIENKAWEVLFAEAAERVVAQPDDAAMWNLFGIGARHAVGADDAAMAFCKAVELNPKMIEAWCNLGALHAANGNVEGGMKAYKMALKIREDARVRSSMLFFLQRDTTDKAVLFEESCEFGRIYDQPSRVPFKNERNSERRLRIGYVSGDLCNHSVFYFIEPVIRHHDREAVEVHAFSMSKEDWMTRQIRPLFEHWHDVRELGDRDLWRLIRAQKIDVLIDLSGHTNLNRLPVFGLRAAPVQASWMGYMGTSGLHEMDYRLYPVVAGEEQYYTEAIEPVPVLWSPDASAPEEVGPAPYLQNGHLTLASFNDFNKVTDEVLATWAQVLQAAPTAVLMIVAENAEKEALQNRVLPYFAATNSTGRLVFLDRRPLHLFVQTFALVDLVLDTWPYNGGTTTLHAAWGGVPTLTLYGETEISRSGLNILTNLGLQKELAVATPQQYVDTVARLAADPSPISAWRAGLRERMRASALMDYEGNTRYLEATCHKLFARWCEAENARRAQKS